MCSSGSVKYSSTCRGGNVSRHSAGILSVAAHFKVAHTTSVSCSILAQFYFLTHLPPQLEALGQLLRDLLPLPLVEIQFHEHHCSILNPHGSEERSSQLFLDILSV